MTKGFAGRRFAALSLGAAIAASAVLAPVEKAHAGDALAAGVLGFAIGALLPPRPVYVAPAYPVYAAPPPPVVVYEQPAYPVYAAPPPPPPYYAPRQRRALNQVAPPPVRPRGPKVVTYEGSVGAIEPWSPGWYDYCRGRFKSFDAKSGTYLGYDGKRHFCQPK